MRLALLLALAAAAEVDAAPWFGRFARRRAVEVAPFPKPDPACSSLSDADFASAWALVEGQCPKAAPYSAPPLSDCWTGLERLGYKCAKGAARAAATAANATDADVKAAVDRM